MAWLGASKLVGEDFGPLHGRSWDQINFCLHRSMGVQSSAHHLSAYVLICFHTLNLSLGVLLVVSHLHYRANPIAWNSIYKSIKGSVKSLFAASFI